MQVTYAKIASQKCWAAVLQAKYVTDTDNLQQHLLLANQGIDSVVAELQTVQGQKAELQMQVQTLESNNRDAVSESHLMRHQAWSLHQQVSALQHDIAINQVTFA